MTEEDEAFEELAKRQGDWGLQGSRKHQILRYAENVESKGTSMTQDALKQMYQLLLTEPHAPTVCTQLERIAREALADHAMRETQRLGQEIEQEPVAWLLTDKNINSLQVDSIQRLIDRLKHGHHTDLRVRINGQDEWFEADWLKHMARVAPPQRTEEKNT